MNILMMSNVYLPQVGGVQRSIASFAGQLRKWGHRVLVVTPEANETADDEEGVLRLPAIPDLSGSDFSIALPVPGYLSRTLDRFKPDVVHAHQPFLLGDAALRVAVCRGLPLVFTHHTMWEFYSHPALDSWSLLRAFVVRLATEYANQCHQVIAPSPSVAGRLREHGVSTPVAVIPTGIDATRFSQAAGEKIRRKHGISRSAFVVGHVGRLVTEKNLGFLASAVADFVSTSDRASFLVVGAGPAQQEIEGVFEERGLRHRLQLTGPLVGNDLAEAYHAMNVFAFASQGETQGMVLAEAMTAGVPVVALDAPGARDIVDHERNGLLVRQPGRAAFAEALRLSQGVGNTRRRDLAAGARRTAKSYSLTHCTQRLLGLYKRLRILDPDKRQRNNNGWEHTLGLLEAEWRIWRSRAAAAIDSVAATV